MSRRCITPRMLATLLIALALAVALWLAPGHVQAQDVDAGAAVTVAEPADAEAAGGESGDEIDVTAADEEIELGEIAVLGERSLTSRLADTTALTVLAASSFGAARTLGDVLQRVPGVDVREQGGQGQLATLQLRGSRAVQVLVLVDGAPLNPGGAADLSLLPLGIVERVEVLRGPEAARFGPGALGGVVNIITRRPPAKPIGEATAALETDYSDLPPLKERQVAERAEAAAAATESHTQLALSGGSYSAVGAELSITDSCASYYMSHQQARNNYSFERADGSEAIRENNAAAQQQFWAAWRCGGVDWRGGVTAQRRGVPGSAEFPTLEARLKRDGAWLQAARGDWRADLSMLHTQFRDPQPYLHQGAIDVRDTQWHAEWASGALAAQASPWGLRPRLDYIMSEQYGDHSRLGLDAFREWTGKCAGADARLELGLTTSSDIGVDPTTRLGLSWKLAGGAQAYTALGYGVRHPAFEELYLAGMGSVEGNPDLKPERVMNYEAGVQWNRVATQAGVSAFLSDYEQSIIFAPVSAYLVRASNTGRARVGGVEASLDQKLSQQAWWRTAYTWLPLAEYASGVPLTGRAEQHLSSSLELARGAWTGALRLDYTGRTPADLFGNLIIKPRTLTGIELSRGCGAGELSLNISNVFDEQARDSWNYPLPGRELQLTWRTEL